MPDAGVAVAARRDLTLPGIAGIALTMGMAVDANVLIYERIRRNCAAAASSCRRWKRGFTRAFGTILDSHVTTLVAGRLLYLAGLGAGARGLPSRSASAS